MKKLWCLTAAFWLIAGCNANDNAGENRENNNNRAQVKDSTMQDADRQSSQQIARRLVALAEEVSHVNNATAAVLGDYAVVGIDIDDNVERSEVGTIKYSVAEALKDDPNGANAAIVADPDMNERIREVAQDIQNGQPAQGIMNELADITGRIIPDMPDDVQTPTGTLDEEKNGIDNQKDRKTLDKEQKKQADDKQ